MIEIKMTGLFKLEKSKEKVRSPLNIENNHSKLQKINLYRFLLLNKFQILSTYATFVESLIKNLKMKITKICIFLMLAQC